MPATREHAIDAPAGVLARARELRSVADRAEADLMAVAADWAVMHSVEMVPHLDETAACWGDRELSVAGPGAPEVAEFCVAEFALVIGKSTDAGRAYLGEALEVRYRLPGVRARLEAGDLPAWRARRIAQTTISLSMEAAAFVDRHVAPVAHKIGPVVLDRLVEEARVRFDPEDAEARAAAAAEARGVRVCLDQVGVDGIVDFHGAADLPDAIDFEAAVRAGAAQLAEAGSTDPLDVRRAKAIGLLARGQLDPARGPGRPATDDLAAPARLRGPDLTAGPGRGDPVLRAHRPARRVVHQPGHPARRHTRHRPGRAHPRGGLRGPRPARHPDPAPRPDLRVPAVHPPGPPLRLRPPACPTDQGGTTCSCNIAPLCRGHHRLKTHSGWTYTTLDPGTYLWSSPHGYQFLRDHHGTLDVSPDPDPPDDP